MFKLEKKILLILSAIVIFLIILGIIVGAFVFKWSLSKQEQPISNEATRQEVLQSLSALLSAESGEIAGEELVEILTSLSVPKK